MDHRRAGAADRLRRDPDPGRDPAGRRAAGARPVLLRLAPAPADPDRGGADLRPVADVAARGAASGLYRLRRLADPGGGDVPRRRRDQGRAALDQPRVHVAATIGVPEADLRRRDRRAARLLSRAGVHAGQPRRHRALRAGDGAADPAARRRHDLRRRGGLVQPVLHGRAADPVGRAARRARHRRRGVRLHVPAARDQPGRPASSTPPRATAIRSTGRSTPSSTAGWSAADPGKARSRPCCRTPTPTSSSRSSARSSG